MVDWNLFQNTEGNIVFIRRSVHLIIAVFQESPPIITFYIWKGQGQEVSLITAINHPSRNPVQIKMYSSPPPSPCLVCICYHYFSSSIIMHLFTDPWHHINIIGLQDNSIHTCVFPQNSVVTRKSVKYLNLFEFTCLTQTKLFSYIRQGWEST